MHMVLDLLFKNINMKIKNPIIQLHPGSLIIPLIKLSYYNPYRFIIFANCYDQVHYLPAKTLFLLDSCVFYKPADFYFLFH